MADGKSGWSYILHPLTKKGAWEELEEKAEEAIEKNQDLLAGFYYLAQVKYHKQDFEAALKCIKVGIMNEDTIEARQFRGDIYFKLERFKDAVEDYNNVLERKHDYYDVKDLPSKLGIAAAKMEAELTRAELLSIYEKNVANIVDAQEIIKIFKTDGRLCRERLYGVNSREVEYWDLLLSNSGGDGNNGASGNDSGGSNNFGGDSPKKTSEGIKNYLHSDAAIASANLRKSVVIIVFTVSLLFYFIHKEPCE